jgi:hypothetical protein
MCEYCHRYPHHPLCPEAPEPPIRGHCEYCDTDLREDYEYFTDNEDNKFCSEDCAMKHHGITSKEWEKEEGWYD